MRSNLALALGGLAAMAAGIGIGRFVYTPILPVMADPLGLSTSETGLIASANFLGYLIGALLASARRVGGSQRTWLIAALLVNAASLAAMAATGTMAGFLLLRFFSGMAGAFILVFASALVLDRLSAAGGARLSAVHFAGVGIGIMIAAATVSVLILRGADWMLLWQASGGVALLCAAAFVIAVPSTPPSPSPLSSDAPATRKQTAGAGCGRLITAYGLFGFGYIITATFLVAMVRENPALRPTESYIWIVFGLAAAPSVAVWLGIARRIGLHRTFALACLVAAIGVLASALWLSAAGAITGAILLGGTVMGLTALGLMAARADTTGDPRRALAVMTAAFGLGQIVGPAFAGAVRDLTGSFVLPSLAAALALMIAAALAMTLHQTTVR